MQADAAKYGGDPTAGVHRPPADLRQGTLQEGVAVDVVNFRSDVGIVDLFSTCELAQSRQSYRSGFSTDPLFEPKLAYES